jgi:plasmid stabilization system protein ParE
VRSMDDERGLAVVWSPIAEARAAHIVERIIRVQRGVAWRWTQGLLARARGLSHNARWGRGVRELERRARIGEVAFAPYRIIYRVEAGRVVILTVRLARKQLHDHERDRHHHRE